MTTDKENDETARDNSREDLPGPSEDADTGASGSTDERSSDNRREGSEKDQERGRE